MRRLSSTQAVVLAHLAESRIPDCGFTMLALKAELGGTGFNRRTLWALYELGLVDLPCRDHVGYVVTSAGRAVANTVEWRQSHGLSP